MSTQIKYKGNVVASFEKGTVTLDTTGHKFNGNVEVVSDGATECNGEHVIVVDELPDNALCGATYRIEESKLSDILLSFDGLQFSLQYLLLELGASVSMRIHNAYSLDEIEAPSVGDICYIIPDGVVYAWNKDEGVWEIMPDHFIVTDDTPVTTGFTTSIGAYQNTGTQEYIFSEYTEYFSGEKMTTLRLENDVLYDYKPYYILIYDGRPVSQFSGEYTGEYTQEQTKEGLLSLLKTAAGYTDEQLARCDVHIYEPISHMRVVVSEVTLTSFGSVSTTYSVGPIEGALTEYTIDGTYTKSGSDFTFSYTNLPDDVIPRHVAENLLSSAKYKYYAQYSSYVNVLTFGERYSLTLVVPGVITSTGSFEPSNTEEYVLCEYTEYFSGDTVLSLQLQRNIRYNYKPYYVFVSENGIFHYDYSGEYTGEKTPEQIRSEILDEIQERYQYTDENIARCQVLFYDPVQFVRVKIYEVSVGGDGLISITYSAGPVEGELSDYYVLTGVHSKSGADIVFRYDNIPNDEYLCCIAENILLSAKFESYAFEDHIIFGDNYKFILGTYVETDTNETRINLVNETYIDRSYNEWYEKSFLDLIMVEDGYKLSIKELVQAEGGAIGFYIIPTKVTDNINITSDSDFHAYYIEDENDIFLHDGETWHSIKDLEPDSSFNGFITNKNDADSPGYYALGDTFGWKKYVNPRGSKTLKKSGSYDVTQYKNVIVDVTSETLAGKWWFSDSLNLPNSSIKYDIKFTYNYQNSVTSTSNYIQYGYDGDGYELRSDDEVLYHSLYHDGWKDGYSRIFDFGTEPQFVAPEFKEWIMSNAVPVGTGGDDNKISLFDKVVYFNNMNGKEYSTIDVAKYEYDVSTQNSTKLNDFIELGQWAEASTVRLMDDSTKLRRGIYLEYNSQGVYNGFGDIQSLTIGGWFKPMPAELDFERFLWCRGASLFGIWRGKNNIIMCDAGGNAYSTDYKIVDNMWTHLAMSLDCVGDNTTITIYVNGEIIYEKSVTSSLDLNVVAIGMAGDYCVNAYTKNTFATKHVLTHEKIRRMMFND